MSTWREKSIFVIQNVCSAHPDATGEELRKLLFAAYPFGERKHWPYKVWCGCVREACNVKPQERPLSELPLFEMEAKR